MKLRKISEEVYYLPEGCSVLDAASTAWLRVQALRVPSGKVRICTHPDDQALLQDMFIAHRQDVCVPVHRHIDKAESLTALEGVADLLFFDDHGVVTASCRLNLGQGHVHCRIDAGVWHALRFLSGVFVFHEATTGPFRRQDLEIAPFLLS